jgi:hypothetical protein
MTGRTGDREPGVGVREDLDLGSAITAATELEGTGVVPGTPAEEQPAATPGADEEVVHAAPEEPGAPVEEAVGEATEEVVPGVSPEAESEVEGEGVEAELVLDDEVVQEPEDLTPRAEDGTFEERFTDLDPNTLAPELVPTYKSMQAHFTKKNQANAAKTAELEARMSDYDEFIQDVSSPEGIERLGVELAMRRPDEFQRMLATVQRLSENENERDLYLREQDLATRERSHIRSAKTEQARAAQEIVSYGTNLARQVAKQYAIPFSSVETYLDNAIMVHRHKNEGRIGKNDVKKILGEYVKPYADRKRAQAKAQAKAKAEKAKAKAATVPAGTATPTSQPEPERKFENAADGVDDAIARAIAGLD